MWLQVAGIRIFITILITMTALSWAAACQSAPASLRAGSAGEFAELEAAQQAIELDAVDYGLLAEAIFQHTNERRAENGAEPLEHLVGLDETACRFAEAMVELDFFSHRHPSDDELSTPAKRVRSQGLQFSYVAENIGQVFALRYQAGEPVHIRSEGGRTVFSRQPGGEALGPRSYLEAARVLLDSWMASEGHRANILSEEPELFGSGCELGRDDDLEMPMFYCVQLFFTPL